MSSGKPAGQPIFGSQMAAYLSMEAALEAYPPRWLSYSWHTLTPELADPLGLTDEARQRIAAEQRSKVTFDIESLDELVKLTVVHDGFDKGSLMAQLVTGGWLPILSNLKTLLETGETLPLNQEN
jgi:hypothetical protein